MARTQKPLNLVTVPTGLGPKMAALTEIEQQFVIALLENGGNQKQAALVAGYGRDSEEDRRENTAIVAGWRLAHRPRVLEAMKEAAERMLSAGTLKAAAVQIALLENPDPKVRQKAVSAVFDRSGMQIVHKQEIKVEDNRTASELIAFIKEAAREQGLDPKKLLGQAGVSENIIDAEFEEHIEEPSTEGLEGII